MERGCPCSQAELSPGSPRGMPASAGHVPCHLGPCPCIKGPPCSRAGCDGSRWITPKKHISLPTHPPPPPHCVRRSEWPYGPGQVTNATAVSPSVTALLPPHLFIKGTGILLGPEDPGLTPSPHRPSSARGLPISHPITPIPGLPPPVATCLSPVHHGRSVSPGGNPFPAHACGLGPAIKEEGPGHSPGTPPPVPVVPAQPCRYWHQWEGKDPRFSGLGGCSRGKHLREGAGAVTAGIRRRLQQFWGCRAAGRGGQGQGWGTRSLQPLWTFLFPFCTSCAC